MDQSHGRSLESAAERQGSRAYARIAPLFTTPKTLGLKQLGDPRTARHLFANDLRAAWTEC